MDQNTLPSLLETLARRMDCEYLSDLKYLRASKRLLLAETVRRLPAQEARAEEWNDALNYLTGQEPQPTAEQARRALLKALESSLDTQEPAGYNVGE